MEATRVELLRRYRRRKPVDWLILLIAAGVWFIAASPAQAQSVPTGVASVLDEQAFAVIVINPRKIDLDAVVAQISVFVPSEQARGDLAMLKKQLAKWFSAFQRAGGQELWIVVTLADDLADAPLVVVPLRQYPDRQALEALLLTNKGSDLPFTFSGALERDDAMVFGSANALKRLRAFNGPLRTVPLEAVRSAVDERARSAGGVQIFMLPTDDQRRVLSEFLRDPQAERTFLQQMPGTERASEVRRDPGELARLALTDGFQWLAVTLYTRDTLGARLVVGSKDAASAEALGSWIRGVWQFARQKAAADKTVESRTIAALLDQFSRLLAPKVEGNRVTIQVDAKELTASAAGAFLGQATFGTVQSAESGEVINHLKQLGLAMHNYHEVYKQFPPAAIRDGQGRALLSWRVSLLPFLEANKLYSQFHLNEPWDSEHNKKLIAQMPAALAPPSIQLREQGKTTFLAPVGKQTIFGAKDGVRLQDITDGTSKTIMIVNADEGDAVVWTKPEDLNVDGKDAKQALFGNRKDGVQCAFADGSVRFLGPRFDSQLLRALLTRNGGEAVEWPER